MRALGITLVGASVIVALGAGSGVAFADAPSQSATISLNSSLPQGVDTGFVVNKAQSVGVSATGLANFNSGGPCDLNCVTNPNGIRQPGPVVAGGDTVTCGPGCLINGAPVGELVGRVGTTGNWFLIGSKGAVSYTGKVGELYVAYNDGYFPDNVGHYTVKLVRSNCARDTDERQYYRH